MISGDRDAGGGDSGGGDAGILAAKGRLQQQ
jgi:hypothetical protein